MSILEKITEVNHQHALQFNIHIGTPKMSMVTYEKYIRIGKYLDYELKCCLDLKGKDKISIGLADKLVKSSRNPDHQNFIFNHVKHLKNKERINKIDEFTECTLCCENQPFQIKLPCCEDFVCLDCIYKHFETVTNDIVFTGWNCPLCCSPIQELFLKSIFAKSHVNPINYWFIKEHKYSSRRIYHLNLWRKMKAILRKIERISHRRIDSAFNIHSILSPDKYYGVCSICCPPIDNNRFRSYRRIQVNTIEKQCVNAEGDLVVLNNEMFQCEPCRESSIEFKKCPHCGIRTLRPDGCNYVICGDHRWCFICNERLPKDHNGHNVHYWMGPGSSAYSNECRRSVDFQDGPHHVLDNCNCQYCIGGAPLCKNIDCMNRTQPNNNQWYSFCQNC